MTALKAYRIFNEDGKVTGRYVDMNIDDLDAGDVVIKVAYSSVNFKDALAATGAGRIIRRFPCVGGIDLSGTVVESGDARFKKGAGLLSCHQPHDIGGRARRRLVRNTHAFPPSGSYPCRKG